eukprot:2570562-Prymnesium_polylepis.1
MRESRADKCAISHEIQASSTLIGRARSQHAVVLVTCPGMFSLNSDAFISGISKHFAAVGT